MSNSQCEGCGREPEVFGSSWCSECHDALPEYTKDRIIKMRNALIQCSHPAWGVGRMPGTMNTVERLNRIASGGLEHGKSRPANTGPR